jgi:uncharacterized protein YqfA (UPF0365 family)
MNITSFICGVIVGVVAVLVLFVLLRVFRPWLRAFLSRGEVSLATIIGMNLRGNPASLLIDAYLSLLHSGQKTTIRTVESCYIVNKNRITDVETLVRLVPEYERKMKEKFGNEAEGDFTE